MAAPLEQAWFQRDAPVVAPDLLGKVLCAVVDGEVCSGRIIEVEAYMPDDPASHTYNGRTARNATMFGPPGHLYVYLSYGMHQCANVVTGDEGNGQAVLIRSIAPLAGVDVMRRRRGDRPDRVLADGPGKLCQALGIDARHDGIDLRTGSVCILDDGTARPAAPIVGPRVGITKAAETPWRFRVPCSASDSRTG